jgi:hypothetical protein
LSDSADHFHQEIDEGCQSKLPEEVKSLCIDGSLCVVAFLPESTDRDQQVKDLGLLAGKWRTSNVRVFWLERGANTECELSLELSLNDSAVIAFKD